MQRENNTADCEIVSTRIFNAPREQVFKTWSEPGLLAKWWGPSGFTNTFHEFNFRAGGNWTFTMHGPDGTDYENKSVFSEIVQPERIAFEHLEPVHTFKATAIFNSLGDKTKLTFRMQFESAAECERVKMYIVPANEQNFDRLETVLSKLSGWA